MVDPIIGRSTTTCLELLAVIAVFGCTPVQDKFGQPPDVVLYAAGQQVSECGFKAHMTCIYVTGSETIRDGRQLKWTRHWFRMSYVGRACEEQYGRSTGIFVESVFAIPHYLGIGIANTLSVLLYPLGPPEDDSPSPSPGSADDPNSGPHPPDLAR